MNLLAVFLAIYLIHLGNVTKAFNMDAMVTSTKTQIDANNRVSALENIIETGKMKSHSTDRDIHQYWANFDSKRELFSSSFDDLICTKPEDLREIHREMDILIQKVDFSWYLKQDQLSELQSILHHKKSELQSILHHENYTDTALSKGDDKIEDLCEGLHEYIIKANETAQNERIELDSHLQIVEDLKTKMDNRNCQTEVAFCQKEVDICQQEVEKLTEKLQTLPEQCKPTVYKALTGKKRLVTYKGSTRYCDRGKGSSPDWNGSGWYRFTGQAGTRLAFQSEYGNTIQICGTSAPGFLLGEAEDLPTKLGDTVHGIARFYYPNWSNPARQDQQIKITKCDGYYVFYLPDLNECNLRYCGAN